VPGKDELPSTLRRSDKHAQDTWAKAYDSAMDSYGDGARARRTAYSAVKHSYEKVGDHWEPKARKGPSDAQAARRTAEPGPTAGGVDANASKKHLYEVAKKLDVPGRSSMDKKQLVDAIGKANDRQTRKAREKG
jgi:cation transport regulator ChaB